MVYCLTQENGNRLLEPRQATSAFQYCVLKPLDPLAIFVRLQRFGRFAFRGASVAIGHGVLQASDAFNLPFGLRSGRPDRSVAVSCLADFISCLGEIIHLTQR